MSVAPWPRLAYTAHRVTYRVLCSGDAYRLLEHNCNHFSDEVAQFLCGARAPKHIVAQPERDLPPPLRLALQAVLDKLVPDGDQVTSARRRVRCEVFAELTRACCRCTRTACGTAGATAPTSSRSTTR